MAKSQKVIKRKPQNTRQYTADQMINALRESMGSVSTAAKRLKCKRPTIYNYMKAMPAVKNALEAIRNDYSETCKEFARDNHLTALMEGSPQATAYELSKMDPKPLGGGIDPTKLGTEELLELQRLMLKAKPDGPDESAI